nr:immunoglobulin light chain junction region [Macaca mulatta]MOX70871.1 immunoglobulin light chain junction region [Macaca mulatta]MOX71536.1 immunoglobulin light chain junction region [Macaca mulatta]MOX72560.1 immunoglobulin light chain junction region [Macaca mulatta]MOX72573.1 immunoglobulin light chain junction region [Macaca mulatta]
DYYCQSYDYSLSAVLF